MIRYTLFLFLVFGSAATAIAAINPAVKPNTNITVLEKNQSYPVLIEFDVAECDPAICAPD